MASAAPPQESDAPASPGQPQTGFRDFDRTVWSPVAARARTVVPNFFGAGILVSDTRGIGPRAEVIVPASNRIELVVRQRASPTVHVEIEGTRMAGLEERGSFGLLPRLAASRWITSEEASDRALHIHIDQAVLEEICVEEFDRPAPSLKPGLAGPDPFVSGAAGALVAEADRPGGPSALGWQSALVLLALRLAELSAGAGAAGRFRGRARGGLAPWQLHRVTVFLRDNLARDVTLAELAAIARLSPFHFCRAFADTVGEPPQRHHQRLRVEEARHLLRETEMTVEEIAAAVGYASGQSLARVFRRHWGVTPGEYRRARRS